MLVFQPAYLAVNLIVSIFNKTRETDELIVTGVLLYLCVPAGVFLQFSAKTVVVGIVWSCLKKFESNYSVSAQKLNCKFNGYSWTLACTIGLSYSAGSILFSNSGVEDFQPEYLILYLISTICIFLFPNRLGSRVEKENKVQTSYLVIYSIAIPAGMPMMFIAYLIIVKTSVFLLDSQSQEILPGNNKVGVITHILLHKDSRRIFLFLM